MTITKQIYKCNICGNIIEIIHSGKGQLVCCGQNMEQKKEQNTGEYAEKHSPVIKQNKEGVEVNIGKIDHPMEDKHYIEWVEVLADGKVYRKFLKPGDAPEAEFKLNAENIVAREYCNLHGLWKNK